ncbi:MAG: putative metal-binding motif-containing protein [Deltaproteobacteria bacterium]|nr:putative metal-binding motif-containing protein [Deltaproteobacteria bacterium]
MRTVARRFGAASLVSCLLSWAPTALGEDLTVGEGSSVKLSGTHTYETVTIDGRLAVTPYTPPTTPGAAVTTGWLKIIANRIKLAGSGQIDATGAGYAGSAAGGAGTTIGAGGTPTVPDGSGDQPFPGGGGAHVGAGGSGLKLVGCSVVPGAEGGGGYDDKTSPFVLKPGEEYLGMGSSGGTAHVGIPNPTENVVGGRGGGVIILVASELELEGSLLAVGASPASPFKGAAGGGAGGTIYLRVGKLTVGMDAKLDVQGAPGLMGLSEPNNSMNLGVETVGGSGGGGLIVIESKGAVSLAQVNLLGGASAAPACTKATGGPGEFFQVESKDCVDADGDTFEGALCGGTDCNDVDGTVNPSVTEICDGIDQDCNGVVDDGDASMCLKDQKCEMGACVDLPPNPIPVDDGSDPHVRLQGGLCSWSEGTGSSSHRPALWSALAVAGAGLVARRARRRRNG